MRATSSTASRMVLLTSRNVMLACFALLVTNLHGCGGGGSSKRSSITTTTAATEHPQTSTTTSSDLSYNGHPPFMLEDVGMKGIAYNPLYLPQQSCLHVQGGVCGNIPNGDIYNEWGKEMWGPDGRNDLKVIKTLGANAVRMYNLDPRFSKKAWFDELLKLGMKAIPGISDFPYTQDPDKNCFNQNGCECADKIQEHWSAVLNTSEFQRNGFYHNAIDTIALMNEPNWEDGKNPRDYIKGMVTAFDGLLSAEKNAGIKPWKTGKLPRVTVTWAEGPLGGQVPPCSQYAKTDCGALPGLGGMIAFYNVIQDPSIIGYTPKNDLKKSYSERWVNSLNSFQPSEFMVSSFLDKARARPELKDFKLYIGEYAPNKPTGPDTANFAPSDLQSDLQRILSKQGPWAMVDGANYFVFQRAYWKTGVNSWYGLFRMTDETPWELTVPDTYTKYEINCLTLIPSYQGIVQAIATAYNGTVPEMICPQQRSVNDAILI